jgi:hypothetical protein
VSWFRRRTLASDDSRFRVRRDRESSSDEQRYTINVPISGFGVVGIAWEGTSPEDVTASFLEFLENDDAFNDTDGRHRNRRSLYVRFNGSVRLLTFRTDWVAGFTVH